MELYGVTFNENSISEVLDIVSKHKACVKEDVFKKYFPKLYDELMSKSYPESFIFALDFFFYPLLSVHSIIISSVKNDSTVLLNFSIWSNKSFLSFER